jgi:glycogen operon protein
MRDLVSYNDKHNKANGEDNRDGESHNRSWNCGVEGETDDPQILALRLRQVRNFFATLLLSQGVPMILAGDELGHSQGGNNNPYCQDNELSWLDWSQVDSEERHFVSALLAFRAKHPAFRRRRWFEGRSIRGSEIHHDIGWFRPDGSAMSDEDWRAAFAKAMGVYLNGSGIASTDDHGKAVVDHSFYVILNASESNEEFHLPSEFSDQLWDLVIDTESGLVDPEGGGQRLTPGTAIDACGRSLRVYRTRDLRP